MTHTASVVPDKHGHILQRHGVQGVFFTVRCCNDPSTDEIHHIMRAGQFTREELLAKIQREYVEPHAANHEAAERLFGLVEKDLTDCVNCL